MLSAVLGAAGFVVPGVASAANGPIHLTCGDTRPNEHGSYYYYEVVADEDRSEVVFEIRSNGCCARPEKLPAVFTPSELRFETGSIARYENTISRVDLTLTRKLRDGEPSVVQCVISKTPPEVQRAF